MLAWHTEQVRPDRATLMIVGDTTLAEITPLLEKHFGDWKASAASKPVEAIPYAPIATAPSATECPIVTGRSTPMAR